MTPQGKGIGLLDLTRNMVVETRHVPGEEIVLCDDNELIINSICKGILKDSTCTLEAGATIAKIKSLEKKVGVEISFKHSKDNLNLHRES